MVIGEGPSEGTGAALGAVGYRVLVVGEGEAPPLDKLGWPDLAAWSRDTKQEVIEGAGHVLPETHARAVVPASCQVPREERDV